MAHRTLHWLGLTLIAARLASPASAAPLDDRLAADLATRPALRSILLAASPAAKSVAIGTAYEWGEGLPRNLPAALAWYRRAAETGEPRALVAIGIMLDAGQGADGGAGRDPAAAAALFRQAAAAGETEGTVRLGMLYEWGRGVAKDPCEAARLYRDAAARGHASAGLFLALLPSQAKDPACPGQSLS